MADSSSKGNDPETDKMGAKEGQQRLEKCRVCGIRIIFHKCDDSYRKAGANSNTPNTGGYPSDDESQRRNDGSYPSDDESHRKGTGK